MTTSKSDASKASKLLGGGKKVPTAVKSVAGSDLAQAKPKSGGKKKK